MKHCAYCVHRDEAGQADACFYRDGSVQDSFGMSGTQPCRELTDYGASYRCFKPLMNPTAEGALEWLLEAFDKLECRIERIEDGLRMATKR